MIIEITSSGGFGGAATDVTKRIDVDRQAEPERQELCEAFEPHELQRLVKEGPRTRGGADMMTYRITVIDAQQHEQSFTLQESQLPAAMLDLIDQME